MHLGSYGLGCSVKPICILSYHPLSELTQTQVLLAVSFWLSPPIGPTPKFELLAKNQKLFFTYPICVNNQRLLVLAISFLNSFGLATEISASSQKLKAAI
jgi:hypothetical protein